LTSWGGIKRVQEVVKRRRGLDQLEAEVVGADLEPLSAPNLGRIGQRALKDEARVDAVDLGRLGAISEEGFHYHRAAVDELGVGKVLPRVTRGP
jgi:hypothetical protein